MVQVLLYGDDFNHGHGDPSNDMITFPEDRSRSGDKAQKVIRGNGDRDDNRVKYYYYLRASVTAILPKTLKSSSDFNERYTTVAYNDFGHLKVMPAGDDIAGIKSNRLLTCVKGLPCIAVGLFDLLYPPDDREYNWRQVNLLSPQKPN